MGGPLSSIISNIVIAKLETAVIQKYNNHITFYKRYADDCLLACKEIDIPMLLNEFNNYDNNIKFTFQKQNKNYIDYLDMRIYNNSGILSTSWQPKQQWSQRYTNFYSSVPNKYKISTINNLVDRAVLLKNKISTIKKQLSN